MNNSRFFALSLILGLFTTAACADTEEVSSTAYQTMIEQPQSFPLTNGATMMGGGLFSRQRSGRRWRTW